MSFHTLSNLYGKPFIVPIFIMLSMNNTDKGFSILLTTIMIFSILIIAPLGSAQSGTNVGGIISQNATWTQANSPYTLTGNLLVDNGITLTIQSGVTVNINSYYIEVNGTLVAIGTSNNMIQFNNGAITFTQFSTPWNAETNTGSTIQYSVFNGTSTQEFIIALYTELFSNNDVSYPVYVASGSPIISNNIFTARTFFGGQGGGTISSPAIQLTSVGMGEPQEAVVSDNIISGSFGTASVEVEGGYPVIEGNLITGGGTGIGIEGSVQTGVTIINNTIADCSDNGIYAYTNALGATTISFNNLEYNSEYNLYWQITGNLNASYNWWGTTDNQAIGNSIYDFSNDFSLSTVTYVPFLTAPNAQAPALPTPTPVPTSTTSQTNSPSPTPTAMSTSSIQPSTPSVSPSISEFPELLVVITLLIAVLVSVIAMMRKRKIN